MVMKVSVLIVNFKTYLLLEDCLSSIENFSRDITYEVIVVDNGSDVVLLNSVKEKFPIVKFYPLNENIGFAAANNYGAKYATGEYLLILNNDTVLIENTIKYIADFADSLKEDCIVGCKLLNIDGSLQESAIDFDSLSNMAGECFFLYKIFKASKFWNRNFRSYEQVTDVIETDYVKGAFLFMRRASFLQLSGFDKRFTFYGEEADLCFRFKREGKRVLYNPGTSIIHLGGATTDLMPWFKFKQQHFAKIMFYQKNYSGIESILLIAMHEVGIFLRVFVYLFEGVILLKKQLLLKSWMYFKQLFIYSKNIFKNT